MNDKSIVYSEIDKIITRVEKFKIEPKFSQEIERRDKRTVTALLDDNEILRTFAHLIAYSQNANSELVQKLLQSKMFDDVFLDFKIDKVINMNPCDIADLHWKSISVIRQQSKLFHIVSVARKLKKIGNISSLLNNNSIPRKISTSIDIENFWTGFNKLQSTLKSHKIPFFQSTTSLLHFLLHTGYDCIKPDLKVMQVAKKIKMVNDQVGDKNLRLTVRTIQEYSLERGIRPAIVDFYFLIEGKQKLAERFVMESYYKNNS